MSFRDVYAGAEIAQLTLAVGATAGTVDFVRGTGKIRSGAAGIWLLGVSQGWNTDAPNLSVDIAAYGLRIKRGATAAAATTLLKSLTVRNNPSRPLWLFDIPVKLFFTDAEPAIRINYVSAAVATNDIVLDFHYVPI